MKLTNRYGYPATIIKAIENDDYSRGDSEFSATGLIGPPRARILAERHKDELTEDVDDGIWRLFGQIGHGLLERAGTGIGNLVEKRFFTTVDNTKISAQIDSLSLEQDGTLIDWKYTTVYGFKKDVEPKREWVAQMNIQAYLVRLHGYTVNKLQIWGVLRDWRPGELKASKRIGTKAERKGDRLHAGYPETKLGHHDIPMYADEACERFIKDRIQAQREAVADLPRCSSDDNWRWNRCNGYCLVEKFCVQYQEHLKQKREIKL